MTPANLTYEERYPDDSGVEYSVFYDVNKGNPHVIITSGSEDITVPVSQLEWLRDCLYEIKSIEDQRERELKSQQQKVETITK